MIACLIIATAAAAGPLSLSYEQALEQALAANPALAGARLDVEAAEGALIAAKGTFDPVLTASSTSNQFTSESTREFGEVVSEFKSFNWQVGMSQYLPTGTNLGIDWSTTSTRFKYELQATGTVIEREEPLYESRMMAKFSQSLLEGHRMASNLEAVRQADRARDVAEATRKATQQQSLADTASAYWSTRTQGRLLEIAQLAVETAREEQRVVYAKVDQGTLAPVERARVDALLVQAERDLLTATDAAQNAEDGLLLLIGEAPGTSLVLTTEPADPVSMTLDLATLEAAAIENNAELVAARMSEEAAQMARRDAKHRRLPQLDINASYALIGYEPYTGAAARELFSGDLPEWSVGGTLNMPLLGRADRGQFLQAAARAAKSRSDRINLERTIRGQVRTQARAVEGAVAQVRLARANLDLAERTLEADRALVSAGRVIQKDLLDSIRAVDDARAQLEQAKGDYQLAIIELERLKGSL